ncbi:MAG: histidinol-phosphate transaminase [Thermodesulfovibrionia bacterium]
MKGISSIVKENIRSLKPYEVADYPCNIRLDANESAYPILYPLSVVKKTLQRLNRYPDPLAKDLRGIASRIFNVKTDNILHGNGSDELIYYLITAFGGPVLYPIPTFSMYGVIAQALNEKGIGVSLDRGFDIDMDKTLKAIKRHRPRLIFLSSPNNPTGNCLSLEKTLEIIRYTSNTSLVIVDEAYQPFSRRESLIPFIKRYKNLAIMRTLSKIGFAGLRVGFIIADGEIIRLVNKVRLPFNVNSISQTIAVIALNDMGTIQSNIERIVSERERLLSEMSRIEGVHPYPSDANFILFKVKRPDWVFNELIKRGILIRNMKGSVDGCLRVTIGRPKENRVFLNALKGVLLLSGSPEQVGE